ncbi:unnamed protein product [Gordionus sp. m RMFG-2023]
MLCDLNLQKYKNGLKILLDGNIGTIRYVGPLLNKKGTWIGLEWDDENKGKHDGVYQDIRYFQTKKSKNGSFLPYEVIKEKVNFGQTCKEALINQYSDSFSSPSIYINHNQCVEKVGFEDVTTKQKDLKNLKIIGLSNKYISCLDNHESLSNLAPNVVNLDISINLFTHFKDIIHIFEDLSFLEELNISNNQLSLKDLDRFNRTFPHVKRLVANKMNYDWSQVAKLLQIFPTLNELYLGNNDLSHLALDNFMSWQNDISPLAKIFPNLFTLNLNHVCIGDIDGMLHKPENAPYNFECLRTLYLHDCQIRDWISINNLLKIAPNLENLTISSNPIALDPDVDSSTLDPYSKELSRIDWCLIAKLPKLKILNGSTLHLWDRKNAEIYYLKHFAEDYHKIGVAKDNTPSSDFCTLHPTYPSLVEKYGAPDSMISVANLNHSKISDDLIKIVFMYNDKRLVKRLPSNMTISKCKSLIKRAFKIDSHLFGDVLLTLKDIRHENGNDVNLVYIDLENDYSELSFYSIKNNDEIIVKISN